jgi:hypothetical protein
LAGLLGEFGLFELLGEVLNVVWAGLLAEHIEDLLESWVLLHVG